MVGSSAGALIGLMFVVVTLTAGRDRAEVERGKHLYTSPIVWHLGVILTLSGAAAVPGMSPRMFGVASGGLAVLGLGWGVRSTVGIARRLRRAGQRRHARLHRVAPHKHVPARDDDGHPPADQIGRQLRQSTVIITRPTEFDCYVAALDVAGSRRPLRNAAKKFELVSGVPPSRYPITGIGCCPHTAIGHAAAPPRSEMKSRRCIAFPQAQGNAHLVFNSGHQNRKLRPAEWGATISVHCENPGAANGRYGS